MGDDGVAGDGPPDDPPARHLAERAKAQDAAAWSALFEAHCGTIYGFIRARLGPDIAEDLAAQVFEIAYARAAHFDDRGLPIEAWLFGIARNLVRDHLKKLTRRGREEELVDDQVPAMGDSAGLSDLRHDLALAMHHLTEDQQAVISLRFLLDRSVAETALTMGRSEDAVKNLQRRALTALQRALASEGYPAAGAQR